MKEQILQKLDKAIRTDRSISERKKSELLSLLEQLENSEHPEAAPDSGMDEFRNSILEFEVSHPDLVEMTNRACKILSDIGI